MEQLTAQDASFLYLETAHAPMSGSSFMIYDPSTAPGGKVTFKGLMSHIERRLHLAPALRRRVVHVPFDADHPWWVDDASFDIEFHVRHIALPGPGDWRQLCILVAREGARQLDLTRPLWEMYVIDGLDNVAGYPPGCFGVLIKVHHAAVDGVSGAELMAAIHDLTPEAADPTPADPWKGEATPTEMDLLTRAAWKNAMQPWRMMETLATNATRQAAALTPSRPAPVQQPAAAPTSRFNAPVTSHRVVDARLFALEDLRALRALAPGCTVNDVVLTIFGGALRDYLQQKGELPQESLTAMCPISLRSEADKGAGGNQVGAMIVPLRTDLGNGRRRLAAIYATTASAKELNNAVDARSLTDYSQFIPAATAALAGRMTSAMALTASQGNPPYNTVVTNVPGPQQPLYMAGARALAMFGVGIPHDNMGLMNTVGSYCGQVAVGFTACREMMPDPANYAECIERAYEDLAEALRRQEADAAKAAAAEAARSKGKAKGAAKS